MYPCDNGDCSNWADFVATAVEVLRDTGMPMSYDIWNEPDNGGTNQQWDLT